MSVVDQIRKEQEGHEVYGGLFAALNVFASRTIEEFFSDTPSMPLPVLSFTKEHGDVRASFQPTDGLLLHNRINLNPEALRDGEEAAVSLAHELVHLWQSHIGDELSHDEKFRTRLLSLGIRCEGEKAYTTGFEIAWEAWMAENEDLELKKFLLPGSNRKPRRRMIRHCCPGCGNCFHTRRELNVLCGDCDEKFEVEK